MMFDMLEKLLANVWETPAVKEAAPKRAPQPRAAAAEGEAGQADASAASAAGALFGRFADDSQADPAIAEARQSLTGDVAMGVQPEKAAAPVKELPADKQGKAVEQMTDKEFNAYLLSVSGGETKDLLAVVGAVKGDPKRKLALWARVHGAEVERDLDADLAGTDQSEESLDALFRRVNTNNETKVEIKDEQKFLEDKMKGVNLSDPAAVEKMNKDIDEMVARKEKEHEIERKFNVNITNDRGEADDLRGEGKDTVREHAGVRANGSKVVWTSDQLDNLDAALSSLPQNQLHDGKQGMEDKMKVTEFHRAIKNPGTAENPSGDNAENFMNGKINAYDNSDVDKADGYHDREKREMADPEVVKNHGTEAKFQERVLLHEMGHSVNAARPETMDTYTRLLAEKHAASLAAGKNEYQAGEYFAQDYMHAIVSPTTAAKKAFEVPAQDFSKHQTELMKEIQNPAADPKKIAALQAEVNEDIFKMMVYPQMYYAMRNGTFHTDVAEADAAKRLEGQLSKDDMAEFHRQAQLVSTPEQLEEIAKKFASGGH